MMLTATRLRELFTYDPDTGDFVWKEKISRKVVVGLRAGCTTKAGYIVIGIGGTIYYAHRLACLYMTGTMPDVVDHRNGDRSNNSWTNLRAASSQQNAFNSRRPTSNASGFKGVSWHKVAGKWSAQIIIAGKQTHLGLFTTPDDAHAAYMAAAREVHPEFARAS